MRLICPNCDAQYEVDAAMIPASGRDVQCSNCGKTWLQGPAAPATVHAPAPNPEPEPAPEPTSETDAAEDKSGDGLGEETAAFFEKPASAADPAAEDSVPSDDNAEEAVGEPAPAVTAAAAEDEAEAEQQIEPDDEAPAEAGAASGVPEEPETDAPDQADEDPAPIRERPPIDPKVLGILRAEAEREIAARRAEEAAAIETQGDLGLDEPHADRDTPSDTEIRTARLRGMDEDGDARHARTAILPDIDDINASLTATSDRGLPDTPAEVAVQVQKRRSGFRAGFSVVMLVVAAVILTYLFAPQIAAAIPALEPALAAFVDWANGMRLAIDGALDSSATNLSGG